MKNGLYHIENNKIYKMRLDGPMERVGTVTSDEAIESIIDSVTEYMYCNWGDCHMNEGTTWDELQEVRNEIKTYAMEMIKSNLESAIKRTNINLDTELNHSNTEEMEIC